MAATLTELPTEGQKRTCRLCNNAIVWHFDVTEGEDGAETRSDEHGFWYDADQGTECCPSEDDAWHEPKKLTAAEKRYAAVGAITSAACDDEHNFILVFNDAQKANTAANIRVTLQPLGRTERWQSQVEGWAHLIENADTADEFRWAFFQGGIYAANAAE